MRKERFFNLFLLIAFLMIFLLSLADLVQAVLLYRYSDECYLTAQGIAAVEGVYEKEMEVMKYWEGCM